MTKAPTLSHLHVLSRDAGERLLAAGLTLSLAESCTGGLVASILTDIAGSSAYVLGGVVSYSNEAKMRLLGVPERVLAAHGAVSAETAAAMAAGARTLFGSDLALSVTGIAGPGGGAPSKPVGLVYLHLSSATSEEAVLHTWPYDRAGNKRASVAAALGMILRHLAVSTPSGQRPAGAGKPVVVEATQRNGRWTVRAVWLDDRRCEVVGQGRQTSRPDGSVELLVEAVGGVRLALIVDTERGVWWVRQVWPASGAGPLA